MSNVSVLQDCVVIFDLDGTLVDSAPDLAAAMNHVLAQKGHPPTELAAVRHLVGNGAKALLVKSFADYGLPDIPDSEMEDYIEQFITYYRAHIADLSKPFPGALEAITDLKDLGASIAICTNKREELTYPLLDALNLTGLFGAIICRDTLPVFKPDPAPLLACLDRTGSDRGIMLGDTTTDLNAAIAADMPCLIADFGYGTFTDAEIKKARQFSDYAEIPGLVSELLGTL